MALKPTGCWPPKVSQSQPDNGINPIYVLLGIIQLALHLFHNYNYIRFVKIYKQNNTSESSHCSFYFYNILHIEAQMKWQHAICSLKVNCCISIKFHHICSNGPIYNWQSIVSVNIYSTYSSVNKKENCSMNQPTFVYNNMINDTWIDCMTHA